MELGYYVWIAAPRHRIWVRDDFEGGGPVAEREVSIEVERNLLMPQGHWRMTLEETEELIEALQTAVEKARSLLKEN
jgi:hypothetical protein